MTKGNISKTTPVDENGKVDHKKLGKLSRARGARFELKARADFENSGWIIDKWTNNVDLEMNKLVKAKRKYNPFRKALSVGTGFPDFICFRRANKNFEIILLEVKRNGTLDKEEKLKCAWYLKNKIVDKILIAIEKRENRKIVVEYADFKDKYPKFLK